MYEDSHINQVSFTTHCHPTEYLRCDIHHVDNMQPQKASSRTETHTLQTPLPLPTSQQSNTHPAKEAYQPLEIIPAPADGKSEKHATHLNSQR